MVGEVGGSMDLGESWQRGRNAWGMRGLFPTSCVKELNLSGRSRLLSERSAQAQASELPPHALGQARALMSLHAQLKEELDFREGDLIVITGLPEPGWYQGELEGRQGVFPEGFVELLGPLRSPQEPLDCQYLSSDFQQFGDEEPYEAEEDEEMADEEEEEEEEVVEEESMEGREEEEQKDVSAEEGGNEEDEEEGGVYVVALYEFRAMEVGELDFDRGDRIRVVSTLEDGWLEGELRGRRGIFPHRFVKDEGDAQNCGEEKAAGELDKDEGGADACESELVLGEWCHDGSEGDSGWSHFQDHTIWDLDYFEQRTQSENRSSSGDGRSNQPARPAAPPPQQRPNRPRSMPPARPSLPTRPCLPARHRLSGPAAGSSGPAAGSSGPAAGPSRPLVRSSGLTLAINGDSPPPQSSDRLRRSLTLPRAEPTWASDVGPGRRSQSPAEGGKSATLGRALLSLAHSHRQRKLSRHGSVNDADMMGSGGVKQQRPQRAVRRNCNSFRSASLTLKSLAASAGDLEAKLSQQLFEFEKSLTLPDDSPPPLEAWPAGRHHSNSNGGGSSSGGHQSPTSRHFSIVGFRSEDDVLHGSSRRSLRPPPPRPGPFQQGAPTTYRPARPPPRPPPHCERQNTPPPPPVDDAVFQGEDVGLLGEQVHEVQTLDDVEMELESQRRRREEEEEQEEEERYQLLLRLQEVESDMEAYAHTAEELRAMLEEEEDDTARMQALENLEFCSYTLETLALEQQQLQGEIQFPFVCLSIWMLGRKHEM